MGEMSKKKAVILIGCIVGAVLFLLGLGYRAAEMRDKGNHIAHYPLLDVSINNPKTEEGILNFDPLRQNIKQYLDDLNIPHSFYFEYLPNGISIRDGEDQNTVAASLIKTPIVMDLYRLAELKKLDLRQTTTVQQSDIDSDPKYGDAGGLTESDISVGQTITYKQAAYLALHNSDNTAINIVKRVIGPLMSDDNDVVSSLDIAYTNTGSDPSSRVFNISARSYSSILKCLYYSCFLNPENSQEVLTNLIDSAGKDKLVAGLPAGIQIAHKIGSANNKQSDCGIVYQPKRPYLACVMFFPDQNTTAVDTSPYFQKISKMIPDYVVSK